MVWPFNEGSLVPSQVSWFDELGVPELVLPLELLVLLDGVEVLFGPLDDDVDGGAPPHPATKNNPAKPANSAVPLRFTKIPPISVVYGVRTPLPLVRADLPHLHPVVTSCSGVPEMPWLGRLLTRLHSQFVQRFQLCATRLPLGALSVHRKAFRCQV